MIIDLEGFAFEQLGGEVMKVAKSSIGCHSDNFPDTLLGKIYIINAPGIGVGDKRDKDTETEWIRKRGGDMQERERYKMRE